MEQSSMATVNPPFLTLPPELGVKILSFVDQKTLLIFERVSKSVADYVNEAWRIHKSLVGFKFSWADCQGKNCPKKWEFILTRALIHYTNSNTSFNDNGDYYENDSLKLYFKAKLQQISLNYCKLKTLTECFPSFGAYIRLNSAKNMYDYGCDALYRSYLMSKQNEIFEINMKYYNLLMSDVLEISELPSNFQPYVSAYLLAQIKRQLVKKKIFSNQSESLLDRNKKWAVEKKSNTLQNILSNPQNPSDFNHIPPMLLNDLKQKNKICNIPSEHGGELLLRALFNINKAKPKTGKVLKEGNQYLLDAIEQQATCASQLAFNLLYKDVNMFAVTDEELIQSYEPLATSSAKQGDFSSVFNLVYLKLSAEKWAEAESLCEDYLEKVANKCIHGIDLLHILYALTGIKVKFKKFQEVELLFTEIHTVLLTLNQALMNMINIDSVLVVYKKEIKNLSAEEFFKELGTFFFDAKVVKKKINFNRIKFLSDLLIAAQMSEKWKMEEIFLAIHKDKWFSLEVQEEIWNLQKREMKEIQNKEPQSTEKELQEPVSKRARYN